MVGSARAVARAAGCGSGCVTGGDQSQHRGVVLDALGKGAAQGAQALLGRVGGPHGLKGQGYGPERFRQPGAFTGRSRCGKIQIVY
jgi:hypothetical protein